MLTIELEHIHVNLTQLSQPEKRTTCKNERFRNHLVDWGTEKERESKKGEEGGERERERDACVCFVLERRHVI
jgi:hypothetical protein